VLISRPTDDGSLANPAPPPPVGTAPLEAGDAADAAGCVAGLVIDDDPVSPSGECPDPRAAGTVEP
jgi:hypothetical protein